MEYISERVKKRFIQGADAGEDVVEPAPNR
jgi:hypothetical protein